jgi:sugar/nucleoside kinase (ribokinase family)
LESLNVDKSESPVEASDVIVAGHVCLDINPRLEIRGRDLASLFAPGGSVQVGPADITTGGCVPNTGQALHHLGMRVRLQGKIGDDLFGQALLIRLASDGLEKGMVVVPGEVTSYTLVIAPPGIDRMFLHCSGANDTFQASDVRFELVESTRIFHLGYPPYLRNLYKNNGEELVSILERAKECGAATSLDMAMPDPEGPSGSVDWVAILKRTLPYVDYFLPSAEEMLFVLDRECFDALSEDTLSLRPGGTEGRANARRGSQSLLDLIGEDLISQMARCLLGMGPAVVGLKCGQRGFYLRTARQERLEKCGRGRVADLINWAGRELWEPSFQLQVANATGAGDSAIAGFLTALLQGCSIEQTLRVASAVGGFNARTLDAANRLRSWEETLARVESGWPKNRLDLTTPGWLYDSNQLWHGPADNL